MELLNLYSNATILKIKAVFIAIKNIHIFIFDYLGLLNKTKRSVYNLGNGYKMLARNGTPDKGEIAMVISGFEYPMYFLKFLDENSIVFDIGSHIGSFVCFLNKNIKVKKIYAFEPFDENFDILRSNINLNSFNNVILVNSCVGESDGYCYIDTTVGTDAVKIIDIKKFDIYQNINCYEYKKVPMISLQTFCERNKICNIDLIKIDCEGYEYKILQKSEEFIKKNVRNVILEVHNIDNTYNECYIINKFIDMNFEIKRYQRIDMPLILIFKNTIL